MIFANDSTVGKGDMGIDAGMSIDGAVVGGMDEGTSAASSLGTASIAAALCWPATGVASGSEDSPAATLGELLTDVASGSGEDAGAGCWELTNEVVVGREVKVSTPTVAPLGSISWTISTVCTTRTMDESPSSGGCCCCCCCWGGGVTGCDWGRVWLRTCDCDGDGGGSGGGDGDGVGCSDWGGAGGSSWDSSSCWRSCSRCCSAASSFWR